MAEFLDSFDAEKGQILAAMADFERAWTMFQERQGGLVRADEAATSLIEDELTRLRRDLDATRFTVGLFGLIKRGKSTLLNALVGREVSSMHVTPETAVPVYVSYGETPHGLVHFADGRVEKVAVHETAAYTSQRHNARNQLGVTHVEQFVPVGFLRHG
ncbi:MAG: dynamin family protein, partial [Nitriliruptorales bacterium]|nr:dynamin family protein [Nitriliruptorales bacterium]